MNPLPSGPSAVVGDAKLYHADCRDVLRSLPDNSIDSIVSDPPYFLTSIVKRFGKESSAPAKFGADGAFKRLSGGFMNKSWDAPDTAPIDPAFAHYMAGFIDGEGCFHVHKKNVNGCETYDCQFSLTLRADDADIVDSMRSSLGGIGSIAKRPAKGKAKEQVRWCVSSKADCMRLRAVLSVFPLRAKKARDFEIWCHALDAWVDHAPGSSWEDVGYYRDALMAVRNFGSVHRPERLFFYNIGRELFRVMKPGAHLAMFNGSRTYHHMVCGLEDAGFEVRDSVLWIYGSGFPKSHNQHGDWEGFGTALKPAHEPILLARKPLDGTVAANLAKWGTGALNIDGCRVATEDDLNGGRYSDNKVGNDGATYGAGINLRSAKDYEQPLGRWPANIVHDGSDEVLAAFPTSKSPWIGNPNTGAKGGKMFGGSEQSIDTKPEYRDEGSAARFFYCAKASRRDRDEGLEHMAAKPGGSMEANVGKVMGLDGASLAGEHKERQHTKNTHPTVKPTDLMRWLCRLVTPPGGTILDPFMGSGSTGKAALLEGFKFIGCEREDEYMPIAEARIAAALRREPQPVAPAPAATANDNAQRSLFDAA